MASISQFPDRARLVNPSPLALAAQRTWQIEGVGRGSGEGAERDCRPNGLPAGSSDGTPISLPSADVPAGHNAPGYIFWSPW